MELSVYSSGQIVLLEAEQRLEISGWWKNWQEQALKANLEEKRAAVVFLRPAQWHVSLHTYRH